MKLSHLHEANQCLYGPQDVRYEILDTFEHNDGWAYLLCARYDSDDSDPEHREYRTGYAWLRTRFNTGIGGRIVYDSNYEILSREVDFWEPEDRMIRQFENNKAALTANPKYPWFKIKNSDRWYSTASQLKTSR